MLFVNKENFFKLATKYQSFKFLLQALRFWRTTFSSGNTNSFKHFKLHSLNQILEIILPYDHKYISEKFGKDF